MKKEMLFAFAAFFFMSLSALSVVNAVEETSEVKILSEENVDVTGDGVEDSIYIKAERSELDKKLLKNIFLYIEEQNGKVHKTTLSESGEEPILKLKDFNHDGVNDLFISLPTGGSEQLSNYFLYTLANSQLTEISVPEPLVIQSEFLNHYKAKINIENNKKSYKFNLKDKADEYESLGVYYNGMLNEPMELMVLAYDSLKISKVKGKKWGLVGIQKINGTHDEDPIAEVKSVWIHHQGEWKLIKTKVKQIKMDDKGN